MTQQDYEIGDIGATLEEIANQCTRVHLELKKGPLPEVPDQHVLETFTESIEEDVKTLREMLKDLEYIGRTGTINGKSVGDWARGRNPEPRTQWQFSFQFCATALTGNDKITLVETLEALIPEVSNLAWDQYGQFLTGISGQDPDNWKVKAWDEVEAVTKKYPEALTFTKVIEHPTEVFQPGPVKATA